MSGDAEVVGGIETGAGQPDAFLPEIAREIVFEPYVGDPRFKSLMDRMNLPA